MHRRAVFVAALSTLLLAACASMSMEKIKTKETILEETLKTYAATIRWGDMTQALAFVDPKYRPLGESGFYTLYGPAPAIVEAWSRHIDRGEALDSTADAIAKAVTGP